MRYTLLVVLFYTDNDTIIQCPPDECADKNESCRYWSETGECTQSRDYMLAHCRKSCNFCEDGQDDCTDLHDSCEYWSRAGECDKSRDYMLIYCRRSCRVCGSGLGWKPPQLEWKSVLSTYVYTPYNLEKFPLQLQVVPSISWGLVQFYQPQQLTWLASLIIQLHFFFYEDEGFSLRVKVKSCPIISYSFHACPSWNGSWYFLIQKKEEKLEIECNGVNKISVKKVDSKCTDNNFAESNFGWIQISGFSEALYEPHIRDFTATAGAIECSVEEVGTARYLKKMCLDDGIKWYKCHNSDTFYTLTYIRTSWDKCSYLTFDTLCPSDPYFYQACGHQDCSGVKTGSSGNKILCQTYICQLISKDIIEAGAEVLNRFRTCNGIEDCTNTKMDEQGCSAVDELDYHCDGFRKTIKPEKKCDNVCDCHSCDDESLCRGIAYGLWCNTLSKDSEVEMTYLPGSFLCTGSHACINREDELICSERNVIRQCKHEKYKSWRNLTALQICAAPVDFVSCTDGLDQVNCTDALRVALGCDIGGYKSNVSVFAVCKGYGLCDDGYDDNCIEIENGCRVHKNLLCDGVVDCQDRESDENNELCLTLSATNFCKRRLNPRDGNRNRSLNIPLNWVVDGVEDCENGDDENKQLWQVCGEGRNVRYFDKSTKCEDVLLCEGSDIGGYIMFSELCDKINTCGSENQMCQQSRGHFLLGGTKLSEHKSHKFVQDLQI
ncbi:hypothetical protein ACHWQZ_G016596 [Mnemiopsis leidyi]